MNTIRFATVDDAEDISFLGKKTFDQSFGHLFIDRNDLNTYLNHTFSIEKIKSSLAKPHNIYWLVQEGKLPIGYAKLQLNSKSEFIDSIDICKLQKIYFLEDYVSQGIGSRLQRLVFDEAIAQNSKYLWLSALKENLGAIKFYKKKDYQIVGEHPFTIGKQKFNFWVMSKKLL